MSSETTVDQAAHRSRAGREIEQQAAGISGPSASSQQSIHDRRLHNEMRLNKAILDLNRALLDYDQEKTSVRKPSDLTPRQAEVMTNLSRITTDGSRHEPQYRLGEKNVSVQVRSLLNYGFIELRDGGLVKVEAAAASTRTAPVNTDVTVDAIRSFLSDDAEP